MKGIFSPVDNVREPPLPAVSEDVREPPLPAAGEDIREPPLPHNDGSDQIPENERTSHEPRS